MSVKSLVNKRKVDKLEKAQATRVTRLLRMLQKFFFKASAVTIKPARKTAERRNT